jgi:LPXTG-site transpeptidase (sortase) family protein
MKNKLPLFCLLLLLFILSVFFQRDKTPKASADIQIPSPTPIESRSTPTTEPHSTPQPTPMYYAPRLLSIPKIGLRANVVSVGLDSDNDMDVPNNFVDTGWYNLGSMPGQLGSTVLDGHSDDFHGNPAVFYYLDTLQKGDQIIVTDQSGKQFTYTVTDNEVYPVDSLPLRQIFASSDAIRLNLITCHGQWDSSIQTYNQRTVIYSVLSESSSNR